MGTTLVAVLETGDELAIASVGDSRAYLLDDAGFRAVTEDQTWVHEVGRPLGLDEESLRNHPMRHVLTMAIGVGGALAVHYYMIKLKPSALLLMCSDGLHGVIEPSVIENVLRDNSPGHDQLDYKCRTLIEAAKEAGGPDNVTCVLLRVATAWPTGSDHHYQPVA
jgi:protein phosphatase